MHKSSKWKVRTKH